MSEPQTRTKYSYDPVGNRTASLGASSYTTNSSNEMTANSNASYTYDSNGNALTKTDSTGTATYAWDYENRLTSVTLPGSAGTVSFKYDPFGRRIEKISPTTTSIFAYDGDDLVETTSGSGSEVASYTTQMQAIDEPLAMLRGTTKSFYEADGLSSVTSLSNTSGALSQTYTYDSFGNTTTSSGSLTNFIRYTGREFDTETGLYFYRGRYYDPQAGRFLTEDLLRFGGGANFYAYVRNNPINFSDPLGLCPEPAGCPSNVKNFFDTLTPYFKDMSDETGTDWTYFAALSAYESGWLGSHAQSLNNPFGLTNAGGNDLSFTSYGAAQDYWMYKAGRTGDGYASVIQGEDSITDFANDLHDAGYNNVNGTWTQKVIDQEASILKWMKICGVK